MSSPPAVATSPRCSCPWRRAIPTVPTPTICVGTPSTTGPSSTGCPAVRASLRLVSTPACRAARAASQDRYDAIDHVMTYFFSDPQRTRRLPRPGQGARRRRTGNCRCCRRSNAVYTACRAGRLHRASRSAPTCCRGGRSAACTCCWSAVTHRRTSARRRRCRRSVVSGIAGRRRENGERQGGPVDHVLLPRRGSGRRRGTAAACTGEALERRRRTTARRAVSPNRALRVGSLCAVRRFACESA